MRERTRLQEGVEGYRRIERSFEDTLGLAELADAEGDKAMLDDAEATLAALRAEVEATVQAIQQSLRLLRRHL